MEDLQLKQADLSKIVSQGVLSEILSGKRTLNLRQIKLLANYFHVDPATFIDDD
jgi:HTH-type transcriptional regulator/antitoxin HigA